MLTVLVGAFVIASVWGRWGYFVAFDTDDQVVIYRGQNGGFLWFDPTQEAPTVFSRDELDDASILLVEDEPRFSSRRNAENFVADRLQATTTTSHDDDHHDHHHDDHGSVDHDDRRAVGDVR